MKENKIIINKLFLFICASKFIEFIGQRKKKFYIFIPHHFPQTKHNTEKEVARCSSWNMYIF